MSLRPPIVSPPTRDSRPAQIQPKSAPRCAECKSISVHRRGFESPVLPVLAGVTAQRIVTHERPRSPRTSRSRSRRFRTKVTIERGRSRYPLSPPTSSSSHSPRNAPRERWWHRRGSRESCGGLSTRRRSCGARQHDSLQDVAAEPIERFGGGVCGKDGLGAERGGNATPGADANRPDGEPSELVSEEGRAAAGPSRRLHNTAGRIAVAVSARNSGDEAQILGITPRDLSSSDCPTRTLAIRHVLGVIEGGPIALPRRVLARVRQAAARSP